MAGSRVTLAAGEERMRVIEVELGLGDVSHGERTARNSLGEMGKHKCS